MKYIDSSGNFDKNSEGLPYTVILTFHTSLFLSLYLFLLYKSQHGVTCPILALQHFIKILVILVSCQWFGHLIKLILPFVFCLFCLSDSKINLFSVFNTVDYQADNAKPGLLLKQTCLQQLLKIGHFHHHTQNKVGFQLAGPHGL